jgi:YVTN family beta-propeller protein
MNEPHPTASIIGRIGRACLLFVLLASISITFMLQFHVGAVKASCEGGVDVGNSPQAVTVDEQLNRTFVANRNSDTVSVIGPDDRTVATITVGSAPRDLIYNRYTNLVYVANFGSNNISVIDPTTDRVVDTLSVGSQPIALAPYPLPSPLATIEELYVANYNSSTVTSIDLVRGHRTDFSGFAAPTTLGIKSSHFNTQLYVGSSNGVSVGKVFPEYTHMAGGDVFEPVRHFAVVNPNRIGVDGDTVYVTGWNWNPTVHELVSTVFKIEDSIMTTFPIQVSHPTGLAGDNTTIFPSIVVPHPTHYAFGGIAVGTNHRIYVSDGDSTVFVINGTRIPWLTHNKTQNPVVTAVRVGDGPIGLTVDRDRKLVYVANEFCNTISVINSTSNNLNSAVTFTSDPPTSGTISCNSMHPFKNKEYFRIDDGRTLVCKTDVNWLGNGLYPMKFDKWSGSLVQNSTDTPLSLPISGSGTLTAHFIEIVPHDIINGVIVAGFAALGGLSLRAFAIRRREKLQERWLEIINSEYSRLSNNREECLHRLAEIREDVMHMYADGTIPKHYFEKLNKQISTYEERFFKSAPI